MYHLLVYFSGETVPVATIHTPRASEILGLIPKLLAEHDGCEHIVVMGDTVRLFSVDCHGNRMP